MYQKPRITRNYQTIINHYTSERMSKISSFRLLPTPTLTISSSHNLRSPLRTQRKLLLPLFRAYAHGPPPNLPPSPATATARTRNSYSNCVYDDPAAAAAATASHHPPTAPATRPSATTPSPDSPAASPAAHHHHHHHRCPHDAHSS
jgi:hypothetical protein